MFIAVLVFSMVSLGHILISNLVVANLLMYSLPGMILLYLAVPFITPKVFLDEIPTNNEFSNELIRSTNINLEYHDF